jgi:hypothetical protein
VEPTLISIRTFRTTAGRAVSAGTEAACFPPRFVIVLRSHHHGASAHSVYFFCYFYCNVCSRGIGQKSAFCPNSMTVWWTFRRRFCGTLATLTALPMQRHLGAGCSATRVRPPLLQTRAHADRPVSWGSMCRTDRWCTSSWFSSTWTRTAARR